MNYKEILNKKTKLVILPILLLLIVALIAIGITNAANNTTEPETEQTFTEEGDGYYIWVRAVDHAGNKSDWSAAQRIWIDNKGPSAPTITGGSSSYALSRTISVVTEADDAGASGVAYYEYCKKSGSDKPADSVTGTQVTTSTTSQTFNTNTAGEYVFFRAVDVVGNKGAWSDGQQVCIDINDPTVSAKNSSVTITKGDKVAMSTYFNTDKNGNAAISSTTYKIGSTSYTYTDGLAVGTHTVTCTVTKVTGKSKSANMTLVVKSALPSSDTFLMSVWGTYSSPKCVTVPEGVSVLKVVGVTTGKDDEGWEPHNSLGCSDCSFYFGRNGMPSLYNGTVTYIGVTPRKTYNLYQTGHVMSGVYMNLYYSSEINKKSTSVSHYH